MTRYPDLFAALAAPFDEHEVKTRPAQGGRQLCYITARTAMNRLDNVLGPENWWDSYQQGQHSVLCTLTIRLPDGECVAKQDAGGYAGMADQGDDEKSGFSDAFKRACAKFGLARYLYRDGVPAFAREAEPAPAEDWRTTDRAPAPIGHGGPPSGRGEAGPAPRSGKALFAWVKEQEQRHEVGLLKYLNGWAKLQEYPGRMIDWDAEQVTLAYAEAVRKLQGLPPACNREPDGPALPRTENGHPVAWGRSGPPRNGRHLFGWAKEHDRIGEVARLAQELGHDPTQIAALDEVATAEIVRIIEEKAVEEGMR